MLIKNIAYIPAIIGLLLIGLFVLSNNPKNIKNRVFALFNFLASLWLLSLYVSDIAKDEWVALWGLRFGLFFGQLVPLAFYYLVLVFPHRSSFNKLHQIIFGLAYVFIAFLSFTPLNVSTVKLLEFGVLPTEVGPLYTVSDFLSLILVLVGLGILIRKYRGTKEKTEKGQLRLMLIGVAVVIIANVVSGMILLSLFEVDSAALLLGDFALLVFSCLVAYAMVRHRLFDVRLIVARSVAYILSLGILTATTVIVVYALSASTFSELLSASSLAFIYAVIAVVLSIAYQPLKKFFDRVTNKIFFRDAYETQALLDELNQTLVSTIDMEPLLTNASNILQKYLKADFATFAIREGEEDILRFLGSENFTKHEDIAKHRPLLLDHGAKVIVTNLLENDQKDLKQFLFDEHIDVLARLTADPQVEGVGYLLLGEKKSGNPYTSQDIGVIEIVANELVIAVQNALQFEEIQRFNITLQEKIDTATKQLKKSNDKLKALDETKDEFISMASHQLRTPLTSVKGYMSMVLEGDAGKINQNQRKLLSQAFISSQRMVYLIADLLNVSRLKTGKFIIDPMPSNLADVVEGEVEQLKETAAGRNLTLEYKKPADFPLLMLDETKTRQVIMNFMDNAVHYTPSGGHIKVLLEDRGGSIEYKVVDDGIGVPKNEQHHLFTKFYRAGNAQKARPDGTGLGLFMAKKVIVAQNGSIIFKSQKDKGSTFGFAFVKDKLPKLPESPTPETKE